MTYANTISEEVYACGYYATISSFFRPARMVA